MSSVTKVSVLEARLVTEDSGPFMTVKKKASSSYLSPHERLLQKAMRIKPFTKEDAEEKIGRLVRMRFDREEPKGTRGKVIGTRRGLIDSSDVSEWGYRGWIVVVAWSVRGKARREDLLDLLQKSV